MEVAGIHCSYIYTLYDSYFRKCLRKLFFKMIIFNQQLQVRGQLENKTWSNIGVTWKPTTADENNNPHGGLTVNAYLLIFDNPISIE